MLALCGDLTDRGEPEEGRQLARALASVGVPIVAVLGNHDYESGNVPALSRILCDAGVQVLDGGDDAGELDESLSNVSRCGGAFGGSARHGAGASRVRGPWCGGE